MDSYNGVYDALNKARMRMEDKNPPAYRDLVQKLVEILSCIDAEEKTTRLAALSLERGFQPRWLAKKKQKPITATMSVIEKLTSMKEEKEEAAEEDAAVHAFLSVCVWRHASTQTYY